MKYENKACLSLNDHRFLCKTNNNLTHKESFADIRFKMRNIGVESNKTQYENNKTNKVRLVNLF